MDKVVGLRYREEEGLPKVILKGSGYIADDILATGKSIKKGPLIVKNKELADQLYRLPVDTEIKPELFEVVATVLAHLYSLESKYEEE